MKLPDDHDYMITLKQIGSDDYKIRADSRIRMHNEQIAAQLTIAYVGNAECRLGSSEMKYDYVTRYYKGFLDKLNKGEL